MSIYEKSITPMSLALSVKEAIEKVSISSMKLFKYSSLNLMSTSFMLLFKA